MFLFKCLPAGDLSMALEIEEYCLRQYLSLIILIVINDMTTLDLIDEW